MKTKSNEYERAGGALFRLALGSFQFEGAPSIAQSANGGRIQSLEPQISNFKSSAVP